MRRLVCVSIVLATLVMPLDLLDDDAPPSGCSSVGSHAVPTRWEGSARRLVPTPPRPWHIRCRLPRNGIHGVDDAMKEELETQRPMLTAPEHTLLGSRTLTLGDQQTIEVEQSEMLDCA